MCICPGTVANPIKTISSVCDTKELLIGGVQVSFSPCVVAYLIEDAIIIQVALS